MIGLNKPFIDDDLSVHGLPGSRLLWCCVAWIWTMKLWQDWSTTKTSSEDHLLQSCKAASKLATDQIMTKLGSEPLFYRRRTHILRFVNECFANRVPRYLFNYFNLRNRDIHRHETRNNNDVILEKVNLKCTKCAFFYKSAKIFNNS